VIVAVALVATDSSSSARPSITVRVDDSRLTAPSRSPAGYVGFRIITAGRVHHHLTVWQLNPGVTVRRFVTALHEPNGPITLGTAVGGNGPMLAGRIHVTLHLVAGLVVVTDTVDAPMMRIARFQVSGPPVSTDPPPALGTIVNQGSRLKLPPYFGRPGVYRFGSNDPVAHNGTIFRLPGGKTAAGLVRWFRAGRQAPASSSGPGVISAHRTGCFTLPRLAPGHYILGCFLFLPDDRGELYADLGMVGGFEVHR
jgi:hypothetical protein